MDYTDEQKRVVLDHYFTGKQSMDATVKELGYPNYSTMREWVKADPRAKDRGQDPFNVRYSPAFKLKAASMVVEQKMSAKRVCAILGAPEITTLHKWVRRYRQEGAVALIGAEKIHKAAMGKIRDINPDEVSSLKYRNYELEVENAVLRETINILKKDPGVDPTKLTNKEKAVVIDALRDRFPLKALCWALAIAESSFHYNHAALSRVDKYADVRVRVREIFEENTGKYGSLRIWQQLRAEGMTVSEKVVRRILREQGLVARNVKKLQPHNSYKGEITPAPPNLINRDFHAEAPNMKWLTDVTEMVAKDGKVYLSPMIDCYDGFIVCHTRSRHPDAKLANTMLKEAIATLRKGEHPILHSDRGGLYRGLDWISIVEEAGLVRSMSKKGCSPDNAACEGFFGRMKNEMYYGYGWEKRTVAELMDAIDEYIDWYNNVRIKMSLGGMSIMEYRRSQGLVA